MFMGRGCSASPSSNGHGLSAVAEEIFIVVRPGTVSDIRALDAHLAWYTSPI